jgi:UDP-N-acetyl-D-mannosaminuronate dehydrogenase
VAYKPNVADTRETPAREIARRLIERGGEVAYCDPHVDAFDIYGQALEREVDAVAAARGSDLTVLLVGHASFDFEEIARQAQLVLDTRGMLSGSNVERL